MTDKRGFLASVAWNPALPLTAEPAFDWPTQQAATAARIEPFTGLTMTTPNLDGGGAIWLVKWGPDSVVGRLP